MNARICQIVEPLWFLSLMNCLYCCGISYTQNPTTWVHTSQITLQLVSSLTRLDLTKKYCYLHVVKQLNPNLYNWRPAIQWSLPNSECCYLYKPASPTLGISFLSYVWRTIEQSNGCSWKEEEKQWRLSSLLTCVDIVLMQSCRCLPIKKKLVCWYYCSLK